jgi:PTS system nitrogen regulatory IIA component
MMKLSDLLKPELIKIDCRETSTRDLLREMLHDLESKGKISNADMILEKLLEREKLGSTSIGYFSAVPHTKLKGLKEPVVSIGVSKNGIQYHESDKQPVHLVILVLSPNHSPIAHLQILAAAASFIKKSNRLVKEILSSKTPEQLFHIIKKYENEDTNG